MDELDNPYQLDDRDWRETEQPETGDWWFSQDFRLWELLARQPQPGRI